MNITRRDVMIGSAAASVAALSSRARAQQAKEIVIGALFPMSGSMAQTEVDAAEIRMRAERRLGEMIAAAKSAGQGILSFFNEAWEAHFKPCSYNHTARFC